MAALGMEDYVQDGVPYTSIDETYRTELASTYDSIREYQLETYYLGKRRYAYDR